MVIFDNRVTIRVETPIGNDDNADILLGVHIMEGQCEDCRQPLVGVQIGILFLSITIIITKLNRWQR